MNYLVLDIETIGKKFEDFDDTSKKIFAQWAGREAFADNEMEKQMEQIKRGLPFSPFLGEIVAIGMIDNEDKGAVYFRADESKDVVDFEEERVKYRVGNEKEILERFWDVARLYDNFVTFNGRGFDAPYLMIRSAIHGIRPSVNLMSNRYLGMQRGARHIDLSDQLTFYGAMFRRPNLHFVTQAFGIESPKTGGMKGEDVPQAFRDKKYLEIARYCMEDVYATKKLFVRWHEHLNFDF